MSRLVGRRSLKRGGGRERIELADDLAATLDERGEDLIDFNDLLEQLASEDAEAAELVKLRLFAGLSVDEAGQILGMSRTVAYENWKFARAWFTCSGNAPGH